LFLEGTLETIALLVGAILLFAGVAYALLWNFAARATREVERHASVAQALQGRLSTSLQDAEMQAIGTLQALSAAVDAKDVYTAQHSLNVADYACAIAREMGREDLVVELERAGLLHDLGKIGVGEALLQKPSLLTDSELAVVAEHSRLGASIIQTIPFLSSIVPAITHHHERWDGNGYPDCLSAEDIPLAARILATADAFDAMTTSRSYRPAMPEEEARRELARCRGTQFDPATVDALLRALDSQRLRVREEAYEATA
jgi:putative nucleotidyltransferase with HDIG domain